MIYLSSGIFFYAFLPFFSLLFALFGLGKISVILAIAQCFIIFNREFSLDTLSYLEIFGDPIGYEPGFTAFTLAFKIAGLSDLDYILLIPGIQLLLLLIVLRGSKEKLNIPIFVGVWVCTFWFLSYSTNAIRQGFAAIFIFYALLNSEKFILNKIAVLFVALTFHWSAFLPAIIYFIRSFARIFLSNYMVFLGASILIVVMASLFDTTTMLNNFAPGVTVGELSAERTSPIFRWMLTLVFISVYIYSRKFVSDQYAEAYGSIIDLYKIYFLLLSALVGSNEAFSRVNAYTWLLDCYLISCVLSGFKIKNKDFKILLFFAIASVAAFLGYANTTSGRFLGIVPFDI
jgi:hypothetical protein